MQLIKPMKPKKDLLLFQKKYPNCYISVKLDGVRVFCYINPPSGEVPTWTVRWFSGNEKELFNFADLDQHVLEFTKRLREDNPNTPIILDGEMCAENFSRVMTQLRRLHNIDSSLFHYYVFDIPSCPSILSFRLTWLSWCVDTPKVHGINHFFIDSNKINEFTANLIDEGHEGAIVKSTNSMYQQKRSSDWCKIKKEDTFDVQVTRAIGGTGKYEGMLGAFDCKMKNGFGFCVGTGFTDEERKKFWEDALNNIYPKCIEVKFMELTSHGIPRHPVFIRVREDKNA